MKLAATLLLILILLILIWLLFDFTYGRKRHIQHAINVTYPLRHGDITVFTNGTELFEDLFMEINKAKSHIHVVFYIIKNDQFSKDFLNLLRIKAKNGIEVRVLVDWVGSYKISKKWVKELNASGVHFTFSFKPRLPFLFYSLQERNHRKMTIIDGHIGYLGGCNIGKEYINKDVKFSPWRDYHLKLTGESTVDLQEVFCSDWSLAANEDIPCTLKYFPETAPGSCLHKIVPTNGFGLESVFSNLIQQAKKSIIIGTPYFIPSEALFHELRQALARNIKLIIIVPKKADHPLVKEAAFRYFRLLSREGATILQFQKGFYHSKIILIDDTICDIGTANFDKRSLFLNHEINCLIYDQNCIETIKKEISDDIAHSVPISEEKLFQPTIYRTLLEKIAYILSPLL